MEINKILLKKMSVCGQIYLYACTPIYLFIGLYVIGKLDHD